MIDTLKLTAHFFMASWHAYKTIKKPIQDELELSQNLLSDLKSMVENITSASYVQKPKRAIEYEGKEYYSAIGSHIRHVLDFYSNFLDGIENANNGFFDIDYDVRQRQTNIEKLPYDAVKMIETIQNRLAEVSQNKLGRANNETSTKHLTSLGSQLQFIISHTTHHMAVIDMTGGLINKGFGKEFGLAKSTQRYEGNQPTRIKLVS